MKISQLQQGLCLAICMCTSVPSSKGHQQVLQPGLYACVLQVDARLWLRNGPTIAAHALQYRSPSAAGVGLDNDVLLLQLWAATAPAGVEVTGCVWLVYGSESCCAAAAQNIAACLLPNAAGFVCAMASWGDLSARLAACCTGEPACDWVQLSLL